ncbi:MAG TPA: sigma-70 family RNA polymerase sigma factor [Candidatus Saccharimonadales bacterium]|nr:sigma-70 family RNA polymerase sigma factor [Candidatus Saccharimonadales bacterium]
MIENIDFEQKTDEELVSIVLENQSIFSHLVNRYKDKLLRYIRRISNVGLEEAEDILQNIFIKVYLNLNDFDNSLKFSSWVYRIAHNEVIDNYRKRKARPQLLDIDIKDSQIKELAGDTNILEEFVRQELKQEISVAISQIDIKYQEIIILKYIEEKDYQEISDIIKKPLGTVASRMNKAKAELKKVLLVSRKL